MDSKYSIPEMFSALAEAHDRTGRMISGLNLTKKTKTGTSTSRFFQIDSSMLARLGIASGLPVICRAQSQSCDDTMVIAIAHEFRMATPSNKSTPAATTSRPIGAL